MIIFKKLKNYFSILCGIIFFMENYKIVGFWWRFLTFIIDVMMGLVVWAMLGNLLWNSKYEFYDGGWYGRWEFFNLFDWRNKWFGLDLTGVEKFGWIVLLFLVILYIINFIWYLKKGKNISQSICKIEILKEGSFEELSKKELWKMYLYKFLNLYLPVVILMVLTIYLTIQGGREGTGMILLFVGTISGIIYLILLLTNILKISLSRKKQSWYDKKSESILVIKNNK